MTSLQICRKQGPSDLKTGKNDSVFPSKGFFRTRESHTKALLRLKNEKTKKNNVFQNLDVRPSPSKPPFSAPPPLRPFTFEGFSRQRPVRTVDSHTKTLFGGGAPGLIPGIVRLQRADVLELKKNYKFMFLFSGQPGACHSCHSSGLYPDELIY